MGILTKHVLGIPKQTIGDSVSFSTWRGKACIKSLPAKYNDPNTDAQISARLRFSMLAKLQTPLCRVIDAGYKDQAKTGRFAFTALNAFLKYHLTEGKDVFGGQGPDEWTLEYDKLRVANGSLIGFDTTEAHMDGSQNCVFQWTNYDESDPDEEVYCVVYNAGLNLSKRTVVARSEGTASVAISDSWLKDAMHSYAYIFAYNGKKASTSEFLLDIVDY